jgi:hypothetical protein
MKSQEIEYTEHKPRPLHTEFYRDGMLHKQVRRTGNVAEFSISGGGCEIIRIRVAKPQKLPNGAIAPWRESYPSTGEFGTRGWYFMREQRDKADNKFDSLVKSEQDAKRGEA